MHALIIFLLAAQTPDTGCPAPELDAQWVERTYFTSTLPGPDGLDSVSLQLDGGSATLVFEHRLQPKRETDWRCAKSSTLTGTRTVKNGVTTLRFDDLTLTCTKKTLHVAPVGALRVQVPSIEEDCWRHRWKTSRKVEVPALVCKTPKTPDPVFITTYTFAAPPGLERLVVEADNCGSGDLVYAPLRLVAPDGGVLPGH